MNKSTVAFLLVAAVLGVYFFTDADLGGKLVDRFVSKDPGIIKTASLAFLEDIRFKDFDKAATYHHPDDQEKVDIPKLIERMFQIKPELLDIMEYEILETTLDSSRTRGRVKMRSKVNLLNTGKIRNAEFILYFHKKEGAWYMELESSLK